MKLIFSLIFNVLFGLLATSQEIDNNTLKTTNPKLDTIPMEEKGLDSIRYTNSYQFKDGFYLSSEKFLRNKPITIDKVLSTVPYTDPDYYAKVLQFGGIKAMNTDSTYTYYPIEKIYGYVQNRVFFINLGQLGFVRMGNVGKICSLTHSTHSPKVQPTGGVGVNSWGGSSVGVGVQINGGSTVTEYIFRIEGGPVLEFTPDNLLKLIEDDEILYNAFLALNKRYRMKEMYDYMHEYNRRNPLYLPVNE